MSQKTEQITIKGARQHNLKNLTINIPKKRLVVLSGVSGSGKSSLAMDTLYAEGQRRYVESLSSYARQFLGMMKRPDVDMITGLSPAIAIDQHGLSHNPRSTVGTVTEIHDYFRVLFARAGTPYCPKCKIPVEPQTADQISNQIIKMIKSTLRKQKSARFLVLSPVVIDKKGSFESLFENLKQKGFEQVRVDGRIYNLSDDLVLIKTNRHHISVVLDRISLAGVKDFPEKSLKPRVLDDVEIGLEVSSGHLILAEVKDKGFSLPEKPQKMTDFNFSQKHACPECGLSMPELTPRLFSFNSPQGACSECDGIGAKLEIDRSRVSSWRAEQLEKRYYTTSSDTIRQEIEKKMIRTTCPECKGARLNKKALSVKILKNNLADLSQLSLDLLLEWVKIAQKDITNPQKLQIAKPLLEEIQGRLKFLLSVGVEYLSLDRTASTLSVGEAQRIRLASQIGTGLTGVVYVLDEPTVGLHQRDTQRLIKTLTRLRDLGNTVVVVEHDTEVLNASDWIIDFGPLAGKKGGQVVFSGPPQKIKKSKKSLTGKYLSGRKKIKSPTRKHIQEKITGNKFTITGCQEHNLKNISVTFPLHKFSCVTGVSGSGKSTLVHDTLYPALKRELSPRFKQVPGEFKSLKNWETIDRVLLVDQSPIGQTSRSNPATYTSVYTEIRKLMAQTKEARLKGFTKSHFSFNVKGGRCETCRGQGATRVEMQFLADVWIDCEDCNGTRFRPEVLEVTYKDKNIHDILQLTVEEAIEFFSQFGKIKKKLKILQKVGLDYLTLGQASPTLSGGESQRLKLARELVKPSRSHTLYLLDEPTTGLHYHDVKKLLNVVNELTANQQTVIVIEHNLDLIKNADWIVDLGPEGGSAGGQVVTKGTPRQIAKSKKSWTGRYLKKIL